ncbi:MAG: tetratricopeptide repeat protein, partial [Pseudomonadota bacterium]
GQSLGLISGFPNDPGDVVARDTLLDKVWQRTVVTDEVLTRCISELRSALGDNPSNPAYIQTVPKRGYRLVASLRETSSNPGPGGDREPKSFWEELKHRNVFRVGVAYAAIAWLVIEVVETIFPHLGLPEWLVRFVVIGAVIGFPVALALAWTFEITASGIEVDRPGLEKRPSTQRLRRLDVMTTIAILLAIGVVAYQISQPELVATPTVNTRTPIPPEQNSIAVLPFANRSGDPNKAYFGDGLAEDVITMLSKAPDLRVSPRTASFYFRGDQTDPSEVAERLRVSNVLEGSVRINNETVIVNASLFDVATGDVLWSDRFEENMGDIFQMQDAIAEKVVTALEVQMSTGENAPLLYSTPTENLSAYEFFAQGRDYLRRPNSESNLDAAEELFNRAIEEDAEYAEAYALLCETHLARYRLSHASNTDAFENAERSCNRATTRDATIVEVHVSLGTLYRFAGQYPDSIRELREAINKSPRDVVAHVELANAFHDASEPENAEAAFRAALEVDPTYWGVYADYGTFLYENERYKEAADLFEVWTDLTPDSRSAFNNLAGAYYMLNDFTRSGAIWERSLELGESRSTYTNLGLSYYYSGDFARAVEMQQRALTIAPTDHRLWGRLAESSRFVDGMEGVSQEAYEKAISYAKERLKINARDWYTLGLLALYQSHVDENIEALENMTRAMDIAADEPDLHYLAALVHQQQNNRQAMFESLREAFDLGFSPQLIASDPDLAPIQDHQEYKALLSELNNSTNSP